MTWSEGKEMSKKQAAEFAFVAKQQLLGVMPSEAQTHHEHDVISLQFIVNTLLYPKQEHATDTTVLLKAVKKSAHVRDLYEYVLQQTALYTSESVIAASSSDVVSSRRAKGFSIDVNDDPDMPDQAHILLQVEPEMLTDESNQAEQESATNIETEFSKLVIHLAWQNAFYQLVLTSKVKQQEGVSFQAILSKTSPEYSAIVDVDSRIYLTFIGS